jgi:hypothetical protein
MHDFPPLYSLPYIRLISNIDSTRFPFLPGPHIGPPQEVIVGWFPVLFVRLQKGDRNRLFEDDFAGTGIVLVLVVCVGR